MKKLTIAALLVLALSGCASLGGGAVYTYQKTGEDCTLTVDSGRTLEAGVHLELTDCDIKVDAGKLAQGANGLHDVVELVKELKPQ
jgi:hypothetical protein